MADIGITLSVNSAGLQQQLSQAGRHVEGFANDATQSLRSVSGEAARLQDSFDSLAHGLKSAFVGSSVAVGLIGLKNQVIDVTQALVQAQVQVDKMRNGLNFAVGSANSAREIEFLRGSARTLGLELVSTTEQYTKLAAAARGTSLAGQGARDVFTALAQASTVMGLSAEQTQGALLAVTQMISKGKVQAEELRGQLGERLPGAFQIAARAMGVTTGELDKMLETGQVLANDFLPKFARQLAQETAPEVDRASKSMQASINRLENAWTGLKQNVNEAGAGKAIQSEIQGISSYVQSISDAMENAKKSGSGLFMTLSAGAGEVIARAPFDALSTASNLLNGTLNALSFGALHLNTNLNLLPNALKSNEERMRALAAALPQAQAKLDELSAKLAQVPDNIYLKSEIHQLALFIEKAKAAKAAQDKLRGFNTPDATVEGIKANGQAREAFEAQNVQLGKDLLGIKQKLSGVDADYLPTLTKLQEMRERGIVSEREYIRLVTELADANYKDAKAHKDDKFVAGRDAAQAYARYVADFQKDSEKAEKSLLGLTNGQSKLLTMIQDPLFQQMPETWRQTALQSAYSAVAIEQNDEAQKAAEKSLKEVTQAREADLRKLNESADSAEKKAQQLEDEVAMYGMSEEAIKSLTIARLRDQQAEQMSYGDDEAVQAIERRISAIQRLAKATDALSGKDAAKKAAEKAASDWARAAEKIQDSITDALMRGFENGKGFAENLRDSVVNMFKTMVLRPVVEIGVRGALSIAGLGGAAGTASAAEVLGNVGNAGSALNGLSQLGGLSGWLTDFGTSAANGIIKAGELAYQAGFEKIGSSMMSLSEAGNFSAVANGLNMVGNGLGYLNAAVAASEGKWGKAIGAGVGTFFGGPIGSAIGGALGSLVDDGFNGGREYTTGTGIAGRFSGSNFDGRNYQDWRNDGSSFLGIRTSGSSSGTNYSAMDSALQKSLGAAYGSLLTQTAGFATALGANAASITGYQRDIRLSLGSDAEANKKAIAAMFKGLADDVAAVVLDSRFMREGEGASDTLARLATNLTVVNGALDTLGDNLLGVSQYSGDIASSLVDAFGGIQAYQSAVASYYQRFYTQEERLAKTREQVTKQLADMGLGLPDTIQAYRDLVNAQDLSTEAGRKTYTALIGMGAAFADITEAAQAAQLKLSDVAKTLQTMLQSVVQARESVAGARDQVSPRPVLTADAIRTAVGASQPDDSQLKARTAQLLSATTAATAAAAAVDAAQATIAKTAPLVDRINAAQAVVDTASAQYRAASAASSAAAYALATGPTGKQQYDGWFDKTGHWEDQGYTGRKAAAASAAAAADAALKKWQETNAAYGAVVESVRDNPIADPYVTKIEHPASQGSNLFGGWFGQLFGPRDAWTEKTLNIDALKNQPQKDLTAATAAKAAADTAAKLATVEYTKAVDAWVVEASKSVPQLTKLRDETLRYYEAQKALAEGMATSAANLRQAVASSRATQLDPLASAQLQQREFAKNYALALSTTGADKAAYADKLAAALPTLSEALKATSSTGDWMGTMARLFAQSNAIADQLDATAPKDYQAESLGLLDSIDGALSVLDDSTRAITRAIDASGGATVAGLRAVVSTLGGVPSFDVGSNYVPHDMFARIHEGEAIVPKVYNPFRPGAQGAGLGDTSRLEALIEQQAQQLEALRAEMRAVAIHTANTAENTHSMDKNGVLVWTDPAAPIDTKVAA